MRSNLVKTYADQAVAASRAAERSCVTARAKECLTAAKAWADKALTVAGSSDDCDIVRTRAAIAQAGKAVAAMWSV